MIKPMRKALDGIIAWRLRKKISPQRRKLMIELAQASRGHRQTKPIRQKLSSKLHDEMRKELRK